MRSLQSVSACSVIHVQCFEHKMAACSCTHRAAECWKSVKVTESGRSTSSAVGSFCYRAWFSSPACLGAVKSTAPLECLGASSRAQQGRLGVSSGENFAMVLEVTEEGLKPTGEKALAFIVFLSG